jgi:hypothetical protein
MSVMPRFRLGDVLLLLLVVAVAAGLRAGYLVVFCDIAWSPSPVLVQGDEGEEHHKLVESLRDNWWFGGRPPFAAAPEQSAHLAPAYPWLRSLVARLPVDLDLTFRWGQCGLGAVTAGLYFLFARRAFRSRLVGLLAGLLTAAYPFWVVNAAEINDGVLASFLLALGLLIGARVGQEGGPLLSLCYGVVLAAACLVRPAWLPFGFAALLWFLVRCRDLPRGWFLALLVVLGFTNGLAPWTVRNYQVLGDVVPLVDAAPVALWAGNNPRATGGPLDEETMVQALAAQREQDVEAVRSELAGMTSRQRGAVLMRAVADEVQTRPAETVERRLRAGLGFLVSESWLKDHRVAELRPTEAAPAAQWLPGVPVVLAGTLLGLLLLTVLGWRWSFGWRRESMPMALAVLLIPLPYLLSHAEALHGPRLPLDGVLLCCAAFALGCLVPGWGQSYLLAGSEAHPPNFPPPKK